jgi:sugar transferase (PEP-CTERM/EpsH1 system associated)
MKITVVAARFPYPLDKGDRLTVYHMLKHFSKYHEMSLVCFMAPDQNPAWVDKIQPFCQRIEIVPWRKWRAYTNCLLGLPGLTPLQVNYFTDPVMQKTVDKVVHETQPDLLYAYHVRVGNYIEPHRDRVRVLAIQNSLTLNYRRLAKFAPNWWRRIFYSFEYHKLQNSEAKLANKFDKVLLISEHDLRAMDPNPPLDNVFFNPHGVDYSYFSPDLNAEKEKNTIIMTGGMSYAPNVDAAVYFYDEILPIVRQQIPDVKWKIVGANPPSRIQRLDEDPSVQVTGRVPDLRPYMSSAWLGIAPIRIAAGLQNKVLEGMSMGLPMVITSAANEGIKAIKGKHVLIADSAQDFADQIIQLLRNPERSANLGAAAREFIIEEWSWEKHFSDLEQVFYELVEKSAQRSAFDEASANSKWSGKFATNMSADSSGK